MRKWNSGLGRFGRYRRRVGAAVAVALAALTGAWAGSIPRAFGARGEGVGASPPSPARSIQFREDRSIGELAVCPVDSSLATDCRPLGPAQGLVEIPSGMNLSLSVPKWDAEALALTSMLRADDLWELNLAWTQVGPEDLRRVSRLTGLKRLNLEQTPVTDEALAPLAGLKSLEVLDLNVARAVTDKGLASLVGLPLRELNLRATAVTNEGVATLSGMKTLRRLHLSTSRAQEGCLPALAALPELESLYFFGGFTDWGAGVLKGFPAVRELQVLDGDLLTDAGLRALAACPKLESLTLKSAAATDAGLAAMAEAAALRRLVLFQTKITPAGVKAFRARRPDVRLLW